VKECSILIVDDNKKILEALRMLLKYHYSRITTLSNPEQIPNLLQKEEFDVILLDMNFRAGVTSGNEGLYWMAEIIRIQTSACVVMITAYGDIDLAVKAVKLGAYDFILKPWENDKLLATINAAHRFSRSNRELLKLKGKEKALISEINKPGKSLIGTSKAIKSVLEIAEKVATTDANILITGENGTGKELLAREIHHMSGRKDQVMVTVDIGAIAETLFESELFGHEKGAFTDAKEERRGKFELAHKGTLFLDEIGNLSLPLQAKLLNVLQNRQVIRVGGNIPINVDIRLISATNADITQMVRDGKFREDLLYRINTIVIEIPPLRQRDHDIPELVGYFLDKLVRKYGKPDMKISPAAMKKLSNYHWPGNVRELQHVMERAVILSNHSYLEKEDFILGPEGKPGVKTWPDTLEEMERSMIEECLEKNKGNLSKAAKQLGISRQTLYNKINKYS
jgi:DNA-binding NtrC family response regulator